MSFVADIGGDRDPVVGWTLVTSDDDRLSARHLNRKGATWTSLSGRIGLEVAVSQIVEEPGEELPASRDPRRFTVDKLTWTFDRALVVAEHIQSGDCSTVLPYSMMSEPTMDTRARTSTTHPHPRTEVEIEHELERSGFESISFI